MNDFILAVCRIVNNLHLKSTVHHDVQVPNVCFDDNYQPVLILDFDTAEVSLEKEVKDQLTSKEVKIFFRDVIDTLNVSYQL